MQETVKKVLTGDFNRKIWETGKTRTGEDAEPEELPSLMKTTDPLRMVRCIPEADGAGCFQVSIHTG